MKLISEGLFKEESKMIRRARIILICVILSLPVFSLWASAKQSPPPPAVVSSPILTPAPSPTPVSTAFSNGYLVAVNTNVGVFDLTASKNLGAEPLGSMATVIGGPQMIGGSANWQVHFFDKNLTGWVPETFLKLLATTPQEIALYALMTYAAPNLSLTPVSASNLSQAQKSAVSNALTNLNGKKFLIFAGQLIMVDGGTKIDITNVNDIVTMSVAELGSSGRNYGTALLADLSQVSVKGVCDPVNDKWYDYGACLLDNFAVDNPGVPFDGGSQAANNVVTSLKTYLGNLPGLAGGFDNNFAISITGTHLEITPSGTSSFSASDKKIMIWFENDPLVYDKQAIIHHYDSYKEKIENQDPNQDPDIFYVVRDNLFDVMTIYEVNSILGQTQSSGNPTAVTVSSSALVTSSQMNNPSSTKAQIQDSGCKLPDNYTCYSWQTGAVIPCNNKIDVVIGFRNSFMREELSLKEWMAPLERVGYQIGDTIDVTNYPVNDPSLSFFKALMQSNGQILAIGDHGTKNGYLGPMGCIYPDGLEQFRASFNDPSLSCYINKDTFEVVLINFSKHEQECPTGQKAWGIMLSETNIRNRAIETGVECYGGVSGFMSNTQASYLNPFSSAGRIQYVRKDVPLFVRTLLGEGPDKKFYTIYPPLLGATNNINVRDVLDFGGPFYTNVSDGFWGANPFPSCLKTVKDINGSDVQVQVPCEMSANGDAHLFPYVYQLSLGANSGVAFSDRINGPPTIIFPVTNGSAIQSGPTSTDSQNEQFLFQLKPEVEILDQSTYDSFLNAKLDNKVTKSLLMITGGTALANNVSMVGNYMADITSKGPYKLPFFIYDPYFWNYNARTNYGASPFFKANVPYKLHPYVLPNNGVEIDPHAPNYIKIWFSSKVKPEPGDAGSACGQYVTVDASQCTNRTEVYCAPNSPDQVGGGCNKDGRPKFFSTDNQPGSNGIELTFTDDLPNWASASDMGPDPQKWPYYVDIKVSGVTSYKNGFSLQGNDRSKSKFLGVRSVNPTYQSVDDVYLGNSDGELHTSDPSKYSESGFPQSPGSFEVKIPCLPKLSACCVPNSAGDSNTSCQNASKAACDSMNGTWMDGVNCLQYSAMGKPSPNGKIAGFCPSACTPQPKIFKFEGTQTASDTCPADQTTQVNYSGNGYQVYTPSKGNSGFVYGMPTSDGSYDIRPYSGTFASSVQAQQSCYSANTPGDSPIGVSYCTGTVMAGVTASGEVGCTGGELNQTQTGDNGCVIATQVKVSGPVNCDYTKQYAVFYSQNNGKPATTCCQLNQVSNSGSCLWMFPKGLSCGSGAAPSIASSSS